MSSLIAIENVLVMIGVMGIAYGIVKLINSIANKNARSK